MILYFKASQRIITNYPRWLCIAGNQNKNEHIRDEILRNKYRLIDKICLRNDAFVSKYQTERQWHENHVNEKIRLGTKKATRSWIKLVTSMRDNIK